MYIWHDKYSSTSFSVYGREKLYVIVLQWSRSFLHMQINRVRLPATLPSVSLYRFFFPFLVPFFNTIFPFRLFFLFVLLTLLFMH